MKVADYLNALPDSYAKHAVSNNYKLVSLEQALVAALRADIEDVQDTLDIYTATGKTLDLYGAMYGKARGAATDEQYRYLILQRIAQNMVAGDYNSVVNALSVAFDVPVTSFQFRETENLCEVEAANLPFAVLQNAGMTAAQMQEMIKALLPVGVSLAPLELSGTFEFSANADEYDAGAGFGNAEQTIGGYFGYLAS